MLRAQQQGQALVASAYPLRRIARPLTIPPSARNLLRSRGKQAAEYSIYRIESYSLRSVRCRRVRNVTRVGTLEVRRRVTSKRSFQRSNRLALQFGFGLMALLLILCSIEAFRIQSTVTDEAVVLYQGHVQLDDALVRLRRSHWVGSNVAREFLLDTSNERESRYRRRLEEIKAENAKLVTEVKQTALSRNNGMLEAEIEHFWRTLDDLPAATVRLNQTERYDFVQDRLLPDRNRVSQTVREFTDLNQAAFKAHEIEFTRTRKAAASRLFVILAGALLLGFTVAFTSLSQANKLERQNLAHFAEVAEAKADLQRLSKRLMEIQEQERTSLSRELHDEIGQTIATLNMELSRIASMPESRGAVMAERLQRARDLAERTLRTTRDVALLLRPALLDDFGLRPALQWQTKQFSRRSGVDCEFRDDGAGEDLPDAVRTCVYRIVQESLHNCEKYARATRVTVSVRQSASEIVVRVDDDGCGFQPGRNDAPGTSSGLGILGMRERAAALNGALQIDSGLGKGTRVTLRLPLTLTAKLEAVQAAAMGRL